MKAYKQFAKNETPFQTTIRVAASCLYCLIDRSRDASICLAIASLFYAPDFHWRNLRQGFIRCVALKLRALQRREELFGGA